MNFIKSQHGMLSALELEISVNSTLETVVTHAVLVLKSLVQSQLASGAPGTSAPALKIIERLAQHLDEMHHPQARACVLWLVGQYGPDPARTGDGIVGEGIVSWAPDALRRTVKSFREEVSWASINPPQYRR